MAKKKLEIDKFDLDSELDFNFDMDDIDGMINPDVNKPKKRTPVTDVVKGTISGAKSKLTDPSFLADVTRKALPTQYGEVFDTADKVSSSLSSLYDETIREIKPEMSRLAKKVDKLVPEESKFFKKLSTKFSELMGNEYTDTNRATKEQQQEQSIQNALASVFQEQNSIDAEEKARDASQDKVDRAIDQKRFTSNISVLNHIDQGISRLTQYNDRVTQAYQKKSLELQYRSYFVQSELLTTTKQYNEVFKAQNEAVAKNTALPEYVKITKSESFKEMTRNKFMDSIQSGLFGNSDIIGTAVKRLKDKVKTGVSGFKEGMDAGMMGLDAAEQIIEMRRTMAESGMDADTIETTLGQLGGAGVVGHYGNKLGGFLRSKATDETAVGKAGYEAANFLKNIPGNYDKLRNNEFLRNNQYAGGLKGAAANTGNFLLDLFRPDRPDTTIKDGKGLSGLNDIAPGFTNKAIKSLTDVIPGYLARIHHEVASIRLGDAAPSMTVYDYTKDTFSNQKQLSKDIKDLLKTKSSNSMYQYFTDNALKGLVGDNAVDPGLEKDLRKIITDLALQNNGYTTDDVAATPILEGTNAKQTFIDLVRAKTGSAKGQLDFTTSMMNVKESAPNIMGTIESLVKAGHADVLEELGLITRDSNGKIDVDIDAYKAFINNEDTTVSSDVNVKRDIRSISPKDALESVKKTKVYDWFYKLGKGDQEPHTGPMAQDVNANMGEEAAPGGTKIDLTTMNGVNMAAIQALTDQQDEFIKSDKSQDWLEQIKGDTGILVELLQKGGSSIGGMKFNIDKDSLKDILDMRKGFYTSVVEPTVKGAFSAISGLFGVTKSGVTAINDKAVQPFIGFVTKGFKDNKEWVTDSFKDLFTGAAGLATKVLDFSKKTLLDTIPNSVKSAWSFGINIKDEVKKFINGPKNIFIKSDPNNPILSGDLMKMGYYFDQITGKVIQTMDDIKGPVVDKTGEIVLTAKHIAEGLVDKDGTPIKTTFELLFNKAKGVVSKGFERVKNVYGSIASGVKGFISSRGKDAGLSSDRAYDVLVDIRSLLQTYMGVSSYELSTITKKAMSGLSKAFSGKSNTLVPPIGQTGSTEAPGGSEVAFNDQDASGERDGSWKDRLESLKEKAKNKTGSVKANLEQRYRDSDSMGMIGGIASGVLGGLTRMKGAKGFKGKAGALLGGLFGGSQPAETDQSVPESFVGPMPEAKSPLKKVVSLKDKAQAAWNDSDASGRRDGSWKDRLDALKEKAKTKKETVKADLKERYRGENVIDMIGKKAMDLLSFFTSKGGSLFGGITSVVSTVASTLGLGKLGGLLGKAGSLAKGAGSLIMKGGKAVGGFLSKIGKPALNILSKAKNVASIARIGQVANVARTALMAGSAVTGSALSSIAAAAGTGLSALGAALSAPVVLGAVVTAAVGYGAYKLYKYATRDKVTVYESIRIKQYGLNNSEADKHHNHELLALEKYLQDGNVGYEKGKAYLIAKRIDMEKMLSIFSIDPNDTESVDNFTRWFEFRFKPFFLNHLTAFFIFDQKNDLDAIEKLSVEDKTKYLGMVGFESGPYDITVSPFKDIDQLNTDSKIPLASITEAISTAKEEVSGKTKTPMDAANDKIKEMRATRDATYWKKKREENNKQSDETQSNIDDETNDKGSKSAVRTLLNNAGATIGKGYDKAKAAVGVAYEKTKEVAGKVYEKGKTYVSKTLGAVKGGITKLILRMLEASGITDPTEQAMFLAQTHEESGGFKRIDENLNYKPDRLVKVFRTHFSGLADAQAVAAGGPEAIANRVYARKSMGNTEPGDGWKYRGRGFIQLTGKNNYRAVGERLGVDLVSNPDLVSDSPEMAAKTAIDYWQNRGISKYAKAGDVNNVSSIINVGSPGKANKVNNLSQRRSLFSKYQGTIESLKKDLDTSEDTTTAAATESTTSPTSTGSVAPSPKDNVVSLMKGGPTVAAAGTPTRSPTANSMPSILDSVSTPATPATVATGYGGSVASAAVKVDTGSPMMSNQVTKDDTGSFNPTPPPSYMTSKVSGEGQGLSLPGVETSLNNVSETLNQSLDVQRQMLGTLREILSNVNPENAQSIQEGLKQVVNQSKKPTELSKPAVSLQRKSA